VRHDTYSLFQPGRYLVLAPAHGAAVTDKNKSHRKKKCFAAAVIIECTLEKLRSHGRPELAFLQFSGKNLYR